MKDFLKYQLLQIMYYAVTYGKNILAKKIFQYFSEQI